MAGLEDGKVISSNKILDLFEYSVNVYSLGIKKMNVWIDILYL